MNVVALRSLQETQSSLQDEATRLEDRIISTRDNVTQYYLLGTLAAVHQKIGEMEYEIQDIQGKARYRNQLWKNLFRR